MTFDVYCAANFWALFSKCQQFIVSHVLCCQFSKFLESINSKVTQYHVAPKAQVDWLDITSRVHKTRNTKISWACFVTALMIDIKLGRPFFLSNNEWYMTPELEHFWAHPLLSIATTPRQLVLPTTQHRKTNQNLWKMESDAPGS